MTEPSQSEHTPEEKVKVGKVTAALGKPLEFSEISVDGPVESIPLTLGPEIGHTFKAYGKALRELLSGKYGHLRDAVPPHMIGPVSITILKCTDGILVRYDAPTEGNGRIRSGGIDKPLSEVAPNFSDLLVHFVVNPSGFQPPSEGPFIVLSKQSKTTGEKSELQRIRPFILAKVDMPEGFKVPPPSNRPPCLASVVNEFDVEFFGETDRSLTAGDTPTVTHFILKSRIKLPVGWQCIEIYPPLGPEYWKPDFAPMWAELDILASAAKRNLRQAELRTLDPRAETRKRYRALLSEFEALLDGLEEPVHQFLRAHPEILCPTADATWSKLAFGKYVSDFVFREPYMDYQLVEIEAPIRELFRKDGQQREELTHAIDQIVNWVRFIEDNRTQVERDLGLEGISTSPRKLVVIGRSSTLTADNRRKLIALQNEHPKLRILTYDDLLSSARANLEKILGPLEFGDSNAEAYFFKR